MLWDFKLCRYHRSYWTIICDSQIKQSWTRTLSHRPLDLDITRNRRIDWGPPERNERDHILCIALPALQINKFRTKLRAILTKDRIYKSFHPVARQCWGRNSIDFTERATGGIKLPNSTPTLIWEKIKINKSAPSGHTLQGTAPEVFSCNETILEDSSVYVNIHIEMRGYWREPIWHLMPALYNDAGRLLPGTFRIAHKLILLPALRRAGGCIQGFWMKCCTIWQTMQQPDLSIQPHNPDLQFCPIFFHLIIQTLSK